MNKKWIIGLMVLLTIVAGGCSRSKVKQAPTLEPQSIAGTPTTTAQATEIAAVTPSPTPTVGEWMPDLTPTPTSTPAVAPTSTPTSAAMPTATPTPATSNPTATPTSTGGGIPANEIAYTVRWGDTLYSIAVRFGTTVEAIQERNGLSDTMIWAGQELIIPAGSRVVTEHVVQPGENLFRIAMRYGTTVEAIAAANGIVNPAMIYAGQRLVIPQGSAGGEDGTGDKNVRYHVVQPGENLFRIALKYNTTPWAIAVANGISNINLIYVGQTLRIP